MIHLKYIFIIFMGLLITGCANTTASSKDKFIQNYDDRYSAKYERLFNKVTMKKCYQSMSLKDCYIFTIAELGDVYDKELSLITNNTLNSIKLELGTTNIEHLLPYLNSNKVLTKLKHSGEYYNKYKQLLFAQKSKAFERIAREESSYIKLQK